MKLIFAATVLAIIYGIAATYLGADGVIIGALALLVAQNIVSDTD